MEKKMIFRLGDGSNICDYCWIIEFPNVEQPTYGWTAGECDYCKRPEGRE